MTMDLHDQSQRKYETGPGLNCRSRGCEFDPGPVHTFEKIDHEIISMVNLLPSPESFKKGCCQLQKKVCVGSTS